MIARGGDSAEGEGARHGHRADGPAKVALPEQPWWRTALDSHRSVLLVVVVTLAFGAAGVESIHRGSPLVGVASLMLAVATPAALVGWLLPRHRFRRWAIAYLVLVVTALLIWFYATR